MTDYQLTSVNMIDRCSILLSDHELVQVSNTMMFIFTRERVFVSTPFQIYMIKHSHGNYITRLNKLRDIVLRGDIKNMADLITYNGLKAGSNIGQFDGLEMTRIDLAWVK